MKRVVEARLATVSLAILIASVVLPVSVRAVDYNVGVKVGDWIKYGQITVTWSGNGTEPSYITEEKKVDWIRIDVENTGGTRVLLNMTAHLNNGTRTSQSVSVDVSGGPGMSGSRSVIASNLKAGDAIINQPNSPTINQTTTGRYADASRNLNLLEITSVYNNQTTTVKLYWDQSTGVMVETYEKIPDYSNPGAYMELSLKATETNMWSADFLGTLYNNLIYIIAGVATLIVVVVAALVLRRKRAQPPPPPPPEPATTDTKQQ